MSNILEIENLSKQYRLGTVGTGTLGHDINRWWHRMRGKEDPYLKIGETNDRSSKGDSEYVWALRDINLEVKQGEVLGIIGKNGAGKSTLLKILSKVTGPTTGSIKAYGRIASLLEVGTGFHPELTGRENIFLNGAILGMRKHEITRKFDEIVAFAGVERYIDTPVKRYSSGMYVRLAFAVAAHLEPEILIVDEVLAVGDAEFQQKALGKMKSISEGEGRTVLFVSHNMASIQALCSEAILMENGKITAKNTPDIIINDYLFINKKLDLSDRTLSTIKEREGNGKVLFQRYDILDKKGQSVTQCLPTESYEIRLWLKVKNREVKNLHLSIQIMDKNNNALIHLSNSISEGKEFNFKIESDLMEVSCFVDDLPLIQDDYFLTFFCSDMSEKYDIIRNGGKLKMGESDFYGTGKLANVQRGVFLVPYKWEVKSC